MHYGRVNLAEHFFLLHRIQDREAKYYADGEDAFDMRKTFATKDSSPKDKSKSSKKS